MARIGYARVSSTDQDLALQIECLKAAGCEMVRSEKVTGSTRQGQSELASIIAFLRPGDELVVTRIDRLARSIGDLHRYPLHGNQGVAASTEALRSTPLSAGRNDPLRIAHRARHAKPEISLASVKVE
jgi:hypothetical protein